ncbi:MAG: zeta toxin family protein [Lachnospiraceae bacterium]|nr:zeta toxin family protein [Lachnospiraceae bacterium]
MALIKRVKSSKNCSKLIGLIISSSILMTACGSPAATENTASVTAASTEAAASTETADIPSEASAGSDTASTEAASASTEVDPESLLADGVVPLTWEPSKDHLIIESDEAKELYTRIKAGDNPELDELLNSEVTIQIDSLSAYYKALYGNTLDIDTPERDELRKSILADFLAIGSARTESIDEESGRAKYVYDGDLKKDYELELVLGLPASGKSSRVSDPDSEEMGAFILDCDVIKEMIPEYKESHGAGADAVHFESMAIMEDAISAFTTGDMKGTNVILPLVASDFNDLMDTYIKPFEEAGYNVTAKFVPCEVNVSVSRAIARELETGRIINSKVLLSFGDKPEAVYDKLATMTNAKGNPYAVTEDEEKGATEEKTTEESTENSTEESTEEDIDQAA